jgi:hypothetical protein
MYAAKSKQTSNSPGSPAVNYFRHFPTSFLKPYGMADPAPSEDVVFRRLSSINCEWMHRPQTGMSKFAETIDKNLEFLSETHSSCVKQNKFKNIKESLDSFLTVLKKLNTKNVDEGEPTAQDVKTFLKQMLSEDESISGFFEEMMQFGGAMYLLGSHFTVIKTMLNNPEAYATKGLETFCPEMTQFKADPSVKGMKTLLTKTCTRSVEAPRRDGSGVKRNLAALLESSDEEKEQTATVISTPVLTKPTKGKKMKKQR